MRHAAATFVPAPAKAWGGLINAAVGTTVTAIQENERRNAEIKRLEIQAQERATEEAIQAEVERRMAQERKTMQNKVNQPSYKVTTASTVGAPIARGYAESECNERVSRGFVANNQAAWNACVSQQGGLMGAMMQHPSVQSGLQAECAQARREAADMGAIGESFLASFGC